MSKIIKAFISQFIEKYHERVSLKKFQNNTIKTGIR